MDLLICRARLLESISSICKGVLSRAGFSPYSLGFASCSKLN
jgi:hypothetical protein